MLLDIWKANKFSQALPACEKFVTNNRHAARRYEFSIPVVAQIAETILTNPSSILNNHQFALPPYDCCYLEFDLDHLIQNLGTRYLSDYYFKGQERDKLIGYLIKDNFVTILIQGELSDGVIVSQFGYSISPDANIPKGFIPAPLDFGDEDRLRHFLGTTFIHDKMELGNQLATSLVNRITLYIDENFINVVLKVKKASAPPEIQSAMTKMIMGSMGEARNLIALLLWLNQPTLIETVTVSAKRRMFKNRPTSFAEHHVLKVKPGVTRKEIDRTLTSRAGYHVRRHEVESFWRTHNRDDSCEHEWPMYPNIRGHYHCKKCSQFRVRVKQHERGSAELGYVTKDYSV